MDSPPSENQPCPLQFYNFSQLDHKQHCPLYSSIVGHEVQEIAVEDINGLESEFMALQHSVQNRINLLESELSVLDGWQVKREYSRKPSFTQPPARKLQKLDGGGVGGDKPKKPKHSSSKLATSSLDSKVGVAGEEPGQSETSMLKMKGDTPDRFWATVEPYCADITEADITMLQEGIRNSEKNEELLRVPPLGQHYSRHWAAEDLHEEQDESLRLGQMADPLGDWDKLGEGAAQDKGGFDSLIKDAESLNQKKKPPQYGPLTERLIAAFLEDPVRGGKGPLKMQGNKVVLPPGGPPPDILEERIKTELTALGLYDPSDSEEEEGGGGGEEDEILAELEKKQSELASIVQYNKEQREVLITLARAEMKRQEIRKELKIVDEEVTEWLKKLTAAKQKRKSLGRKEKEAAWKALETREALLLRLEQQ